MRVYRNARKQAKNRRLVQAMSNVLQRRILKELVLTTTEKRIIDGVIVRPVGYGRRTPVAERVEVYFLGAEEPWTEPAGDPETLALLATAADAETIRADLEERAADGDQSAKDYLEATTMRSRSRSPARSTASSGG